ncbi:MAG: ABC transporter substrate-binding protein [Desulfobacterales bacterium]|jgi:ABC-type branched-subunit amino acid transport system substrate-binding protein
MKKTGFWVLAAMVAMILGLTVNVMAEEGLTDTEIHIGQWGPQTGPAAPWGSVARGTGDYFEWINAQGGIHGRKIVYHMFDDAYNPAKTKAGVKELQEGTGIFGWACGVGTAPGLAVREYITSRKIPWVGPATGSSHWIDPPNRYLFAVYPLYYIEAKALIRLGVEKMGFKRVAIAYQNDDYGKNGLNGARKELVAHGMQLVAEVPVELKDQDMKPHVMKLRQAEADMVLLWVGPVHAVKIVGTSKAMKFMPQFMSTSTCSDFPLMMHISKGLFEGVIATAFSEMPDSTLPLLQKYKKEVHGQFAAEKERWGVFYYAGILFVEPMVEGLKRAGRNLTSENFITAMESLKGFKGIGGEISYGIFDANNAYETRGGMKEVFIVQCMKDGKAKRLSDWMKIPYP